MVKRFQNYFKAISPLEDGSCWYCRKATRYALYEKDGSEIWTCISCFEKQLSPKWYKRLLRNHAEFKKRLKSGQNSRVKKEKVASSRTGVGL